MGSIITYVLMRVIHTDRQRVLIQKWKWHLLVQCPWELRQGKICPEVMLACNRSLAEKSHVEWEGEVEWGRGWIQVTGRSWIQAASVHYQLTVLSCTFPIAWCLHKTVVHMWLFNICSNLPPLMLLRGPSSYHQVPGLCFHLVQSWVTVCLQLFY